MSDRWTYKYLSEKYKVKEPMHIARHAMELPKGSFNIILADPPWQYQ